MGAYAQRELRRRILIGSFGGLLIVGACGLYWRLRPPDAAAPAASYAARLRCLECGHEATAQVAPTDRFPLRCPRCGEKAWQELWRCRECGAEFVPDRAAGVQRCPRCRSVRVGSAAVP